ncbi:hypothetical protein ZOSMA_64G00340 [Zostera marina]|uniref:Uncharacterized protein n=1 Tax=Zostera marina TaxID=29655 RepID=A0A0K9NT58_ZOSMR|nr:hypothetical protein ZOSMA_64G00340 [Zostera marina]
MMAANLSRDRKSPLLPTIAVSVPKSNPTIHQRKYTRCPSHIGDEFQNFRWWLRWICVDQTATWTTVISWIVFFILGIIVPAISHFVLSYTEKRRSFDSVVQLSLSSVSTLAFTCLSKFISKYGLRRFLFIDKLVGESECVREKYIDQLNRSFKLLSTFVVPCVTAETIYKIWWYLVGVTKIPFIENPILSDILACSLELCSWLYRMSTFFLVCVLFRLICHLQILRLQDFAASFHEGSDVATVLRGHMRIKKQLRVISHRFRVFIVATLVIVTVSQLGSLLVTTRHRSVVNFFNTGELALCSLGLVMGLLICLRSAAKITHKGQAITSQASKWHVYATIDQFNLDMETPTHGRAREIREMRNNEEEEEDDEDEDYNEENAGGGEECFEDAVPNMVDVHTISFQRRQAFVNYLENNRAGITVFGFMVDRTWLHTIFAMELTLVLWLLGKTIGFS